LSSFAGLAPIDHPRLAIVTLVDEPTEGDYFGAKVAGPVFARVASEALRYLGVPGEPAVCPPPTPGSAAVPGAVKTCLPPGATTRKLASMHEIGEAARSIVMMLGTLIDALAGARIIGDTSVEVCAVRSDSRAVEPGDVYVAIRGIRADGHSFVPVAIERGA